MAKHRVHTIEFKRQVVQEYLAGESPHGLARRHSLSRNLIKIWVAKYEAGALDSDEAAASDTDTDIEGQPGLADFGPSDEEGEALGDQPRMTNVTGGNVNVWSFAAVEPRARCPAAARRPRR